jgi:hypothetical protein
MAVVIIGLSGIAVGLVTLRRGEMSARHEAHRLRLRQVSLDRRLSRQRRQIECLRAPAEADRRGAEMNLDLTEPDQARYGPAPDGQGRHRRGP